MRASPAWAAPTGPGSAGASTTASTPASRWTPTSPTSPRPCRTWWPPSADGTELVIGSRYIPGGVIPNWAWHRRLLSRGGNLYASTLLGLGVSDATAGFRCYAASLLRAPSTSTPIRAEGYGFQIEMTYESRKAGRLDPRGADPLRRPGRGRVQDVHVHRRRGARPGDAVGRPAPVGRAPALPAGRTRLMCPPTHG